MKKSIFTLTILYVMFLVLPLHNAFAKVITVNIDDATAQLYCESIPARLPFVMTQGTLSCDEYLKRAVDGQIWSVIGEAKRRNSETLVQDQAAQELQTAKEASKIDVTIQ